MMKVYGITPDGMHRRIVAAKNQKEAARLIGVTLSYLRGYGCVTGNREELDLALAEPGVVWESKPYSNKDGWWKVNIPDGQP